MNAKSCGIRETPSGRGPLRKILTSVTSPRATRVACATAPIFSWPGRNGTLRVRLAPESSFGVAQAERIPARVTYSSPVFIFMIFSRECGLTIILYPSLLLAAGDCCWRGWRVLQALRRRSTSIISSKWAVSRR